MAELKINGRASEVLSVSLKEILACIENAGLNKWALLWLEVTARTNAPSLLNLEAKVNHSTDGLAITWEELCVLDSNVYQYINFLLIGSQEASYLHRYDSDNEMHTACDYTIELIDSSYWIVCSKNTNFLECIITTIEGVEVCDNS